MRDVIYREKKYNSRDIKILRRINVSREDEKFYVNTSSLHDKLVS
jgi:hypothetical protein